VEFSRSQWHPIASSSDLPFRHIYHARLLGRELAVWRADDGHVNVWKNRCLHRGVRLSIGINDGRELKCQYHGWRYTNRTAGCTYIPAHPADAPARTITNRIHPAAERHGLVWACEEPLGELPGMPLPSDGTGLVLRPLPVNAPPRLVLERLGAHRFQPSERLGDETAETSLETVGEWSIVLRSRGAGSETAAFFFVQPVDSGRAVIRGVLDRHPETKSGCLAVLRHHNERLSALRRAIEREALELSAPPPIEPAIEFVSPELAAMPELTLRGRRPAVTVQVARKWQTAQGVAAFELVPVKGMLPTFQPGAHIDVHMPNGLVRQYSIVNGPGESDRFVIGVKREPDSEGGSACMHEAVREGDVLAISEPRNNFPLRRDAVRTLFIGGGIGIAPLLAMAQALAHSALPHEFHCFAASAAQLAFRERLEALGSLETHLGLSPEDTSARLGELICPYHPAMHLYLCGPGPMLDAARSIAAAAGWPEETVHFEYFANSRVVDRSSSFEIALARSCLTLTVPAGRTVLEVLREHGVDLPSSCEQGACGTCVATVIEGEPDHQDVYLNEAERRSGTRIMTCVSRAKSPRLVLDV
jgi:ferredoxin-NADP reductase/nitrite reductase/ring-hydroxylating ferredoxin subunit